MFSHRALAVIALFDPVYMVGTQHLPFLPSGHQASSYTSHRHMVSTVLNSRLVEKQATDNPVQPRQLTVKLVVAGLVWVALLIAGAVVMLTHANTPGAPGALSANWPQASPVPRDADK